MINYALLPNYNITAKYTLPLKKHAALDTQAKSAGPRIPSPADFVAVSEENLFHPERRIPPEKKADEQPLPVPDIVLYGTVLTDDTGLAYVEDLKAQRNTPGRGNRQITMKKGDLLSGFTLTKIEADKIVMLRGDEQIVVNVHNTQRPKKPVAPPQDTQGRVPTRPKRPAISGVREESPNPAPPSSVMDSTIRGLVDRQRR